MKRYKLEVEIKPKLTILEFSKTDEWSNDLYRSNPEYESYIFFGTTKEVCINKLKRRYLKEINDKKNEIYKLEMKYKKIERLIEKIKDENKTK